MHGCYLSHNWFLPLLFQLRLFISERVCGGLGNLRKNVCDVALYGGQNLESVPGTCPRVLCDKYISTHACSYVYIFILEMHQTGNGIVYLSLTPEYHRVDGIGLYLLSDSIGYHGSEVQS